MEKKSLNPSKLQRIVSIRSNEDDDSSKLVSSTNISTSNPLQFSTQHDILKYSASNTKQQLITKRHMTSSLNNVNLESEQSNNKIMYSTTTTQQQTGSLLSRKIVSTTSKEEIEFQSNPSTSSNAKPLRKVAVVNSNNIYKSNQYDDSFQQQMYKSSSSSIIFNKDNKSKIY